MNEETAQFWLFMFLFRLRTGATLSALEFNCGLAPSTISGSFHRVLDDIDAWVHADHVIAWPRADERRRFRGRVPNVTAHLHPDDPSAPAQRMLSGRFKWCVGMLDGVCFQIPKVHGKDDYYVARKGLHALNVLVVCDPYGVVRHAEPVFKVHLDRTAYKASSLYCNSYRLDGEALEHFALGEYLLADGGFAGDGFVASPFPKPSLLLRHQVGTHPRAHSQAAPTPAIRDGRRHLNTRLRWFRAEIEHVFGVVKSCYRALLGTVTIVKSPELVWKVARAAFAMYNVQRMHRGPLRPDSWWDMQNSAIWADVLAQVQAREVMSLVDE